MAINIKRKETEELAKEVAQLAGENQTEAITTALRERRDRLRKERQGLVERLMKIARECAPLWKEPYKSVDHGDLLYDKKGLPK